jgi:DNA-directed RNA polymerase subunit E'/Rpb7
MSANGDGATITNNVLLARSKLSDSVLIRPRFLDGSYRDHIMAQLRSGVEGACTRHGYVLAGSVQLLNVMAARVDPASMNGDTIFNVRYSALVCNPPVGLIVPVRVYDSNMFAVFAQAGVLAADGEFTPLVDVIMVKAQHEGGRLEMLSALPSGAEAKAVIVGKRFEIGDARISAVARLLTDAEAESGNVDDAIRPGSSGGGDASIAGAASSVKLPRFTRSLAAVLPIEALARDRNAQNRASSQQGAPDSIAGDDGGQGLVDDDDEVVNDESGDSEEDNDEEDEDGGNRRGKDDEDDEDDEEDVDEDDDEDGLLPEDDASGSESG